VEWINNLYGHVVGLDTAPLIYFIEGHPRYLQTVTPFFETLSQGEFRVVTSVITLLDGFRSKSVRENVLNIVQRP
jgi:hypothetical protein